MLHVKIIAHASTHTHIAPKKLFSCLFMCKPDWEIDKVHRKYTSCVQSYFHTLDVTYIFYALWRFKLRHGRINSCVQNLSLLPFEISFLSRLKAQQRMHK